MIVRACNGSETPAASEKWPATLAPSAPVPTLLSAARRRSTTRVQHAGDSYRQTQAAIQRALDAAAELGAARDDVIRTRLLLAPDCDWREAARAHAEAFVGVEPANTTYYVARLIPDGALVEVELDAAIDELREQ
jgi:enamine deaminase RidA (YjgF/YER057c/UK114 family)